MSADSILDLMEAESTKQDFDLPSSNKITDLTGMVAKLDRLNGKLIEAEDKVKDIKSQIRRLSETEIPDLFKEMGNIAALDLEDGRKIKVADDFSISIKKASQQEALAWLRENNKEEIIKRKLVLEFDRGESVEAQSALELLLANNLSPSDTESVHPQTLKASIRGIIESGKTPPDSFTYYPYQKTSIK